jgi:hypothetical protein
VTIPLYFSDSRWWSKVSGAELDPLKPGRTDAPVKNP